MAWPTTSTTANTNAASHAINENALGPYHKVLLLLLICSLLANHLKSDWQSNHNHSQKK